MVNHIFTGPLSVISFWNLIQMRIGLHDKFSHRVCKYTLPYFLLKHNIQQAFKIASGGLGRNCYLVCVCIVVVSMLCSCRSSGWVGIVARLTFSPWLALWLPLFAWLSATKYLGRLERVGHRVDRVLHSTWQQLQPGTGSRLLCKHIQNALF